MTIRKGESYVIESLSQFKERLNVDWDEIATALPPEVQNQMLNDENSIREEEGDEPVDDVTDVHRDIMTHHAHERGINSVIIDVLEARDREYTHTHDISIHRIIELHPEE